MSAISVNKYSGLLSYEKGDTYFEFVREDIEQLSDVLINGKDVSIVRLNENKWNWIHYSIGNSDAVFHLIDKLSGSEGYIDYKDMCDIMDYLDNKPEEYIACAADFQ
jgi:hypothetical protein